MNKLLPEKILFYIQRYSHNIYLRKFLNAIVGQFLPSANKQIRGVSFLNTQKSEKQIIRDLKAQGYSELGIALNEATLAKIEEHLKGLPCYKSGRKEGHLVDFNNLGDDVQLGNYERSDLSTIPEIISVANDEKVLNAAAKYLGVKPTISNINCWWSFARREKPKEAQFFHRDIDDFKFLKLFVYLTDVLPDSGPHIYVKGSHKKNNLIRLKRLTDDEVKNEYSTEDIIMFERPKGSCFIVDTFGIHKGLLPINSNRLIFQVQYSYLPLFVENYEPINNISSHKTEFDEYVNRLIFSN